MQFDQDTIKELSVYAVQQFVSNGVPLDDSIAEKARSLKLNEDQVRRVVESTNVIAFLKLREGAEDKTFEFQVASFPGVMDALLRTGVDRGYVDVSGEEDLVEKVAFDLSVNVPEDQAHQVLSKSLYHLRGELEKVAQEQYNCVSDLERLVPVLVKQSNWQERLHTVTGDDEFTRIMSAFSKSGFEKSASLKECVFVGKELEVSREVVGLIKQAGELTNRRKELDGLEKKAALALGSLFRNAGKALKSVGRAPESVVRGAAYTATAVPTYLAAKTAKTAVGGAKALKKTAFGVTGAVGLAATSATYQPKTNPKTGLPNDVWDNIYN